MRTSCVTAAMRADAADLDHRRFRSEAGRARGRLQFRRNLRGRGLADGSTALAEQEHHEIASRMRVHAGHEGVAAFNPMHKPVLAQELERAIDRDRRRPWSPWS